MSSSQLTFIFFQRGRSTTNQSAARQVMMACRQLLGPLHDALPPSGYMSRRVEVGWLGMGRLDAPGTMKIPWLIELIGDHFAILQ